MKTFITVLFVTSCLVLCTHGYPGVRRETSDSDESDENVGTVLVFPSNTRNGFGRPGIGMLDLDDSSEEFGSPSLPWSPWGNKGWISPLEDLLKSFKDTIDSMLPPLNPWSNIPEGGNTTSKTEVINGHVVTINETTFKNGDDNGEIVIRIHMLDIRPQDETIPSTESEADSGVKDTTLPPTSTATGTATPAEEKTTPSRSVETVEDIDNEIPKSQVDTLTA